MRISRICHVDTIEAADCERKDELEEAHDAEGDISHGFIEDGHFDCICVFCPCGMIALSCLHFDVDALRFPISFTPHSVGRVGGGVYMLISQKRTRAAVVAPKKKITRAAIQNNELSYCPGC